LVTIKNIKMKEQTLINMKHDMGKLAQGVHNNIQTLVHINTLVQGLLETVKRMPGYEEAIEKLLKEQKEKPEANVE
jgi:Pyruvate/2-oxoacid:ferredoxin oxidoreductase gamma subunit